MRRVRLSFERTPRKKRHLLGPEIVAQLTERINNNVLLTLSCEIDPACIQFVTQQFSSVPMGDVAEFDIECVVQHIEATLQGQQYVMVITAGPPCPDFSSIRDNPKGTEGASGWLFKHMLGVEHQLRKRFQNIPIETVFENVVPHPAVRDNLLELTTPLAMAPIVVDASDSGLIHRKRLWWTTISWNNIDEKPPRLTPWSLTWNSDDGWDRLHNPLAAELQQPIITEGYSLPRCLHTIRNCFIVSLHQHLLTWAGRNHDRPVLGQLRRRLGIVGNKITDDILHGNMASPYQMGPCPPRRSDFENNYKGFPYTTRRPWTPAMRRDDQWHWETRGISRQRFGSCSSYS